MQSYIGPLHRVNNYLLSSLFQDSIWSQRLKRQLNQIIHSRLDLDKCLFFYLYFWMNIAMICQSTPCGWYTLFCRQAVKLRVKKWSLQAKLYHKIFALNDENSEGKLRVLDQVKESMDLWNAKLCRFWSEQRFFDRNCNCTIESTSSCNGTKWRMCNFHH